MKISVSDIRKFRPCYDPTEISGITETTEMTLIEWLEHKAKKLTNADKVWLASKFMTEEQCRVFAIWCARQCETKAREITEYLDVIERYYIHGTATKEEVHAARKAANSADDWLAYSAAAWAAYSTAYEAAHNAADSAADWAADWAAYNAADWEAYWAAYNAANSEVYLAAYWAAHNAAYNAAHKVVRRKQVEYLIRMLKEEESVCPSNLQAAEAAI